MIPIPEIHSSFSKGNRYYLFKKTATHLDGDKSQRHSKMHTSQVVTLRSSTSCPPQKLIISPVKMQKFHNKRSMSVFSIISQKNMNAVPAKASQINSIINKKNHVLRLKHNVNDGSDPLPNILQIKQSVKKEQISFIRRMDKKLNTNGHANLLVNLKQDLHIEYHNYLKELVSKTRKNRHYLKLPLKQKVRDSFVVLPCQLKSQQNTIL